MAGDDYWQRDRREEKRVYICVYLFMKICQIYLPEKPVPDSGLAIELELNHDRHSTASVT